MIADQIVNEFNGKMAFKSEHGKGSTFQFSFQLEDSLERSEDDSKNNQYQINSNKLVFKWKPKDKSFVSENPIKYAMGLE